MNSYIDIISRKYPSIQVSCFGDETVYSNIVWENGPAIPSKSQLDSDFDSFIKADIWTEIKKIRDFRKADGVKVGANWFHSDDSSRIQQIGLVMLGANIPPGLQWKTLDGQFVTMTPTLASQIFGATAGSDLAIFTVAETHKAYAMASNDPSNYNYTTGWPQSYEESISA